MSETTVRKWLRKSELTRKAGMHRDLRSKIPADEIADLKAGAVQRRTRVGELSEPGAAWRGARRAA